MRRIKKRYWILAMLIGLAILARSESLKMRYEPAELLANLAADGIEHAALKQVESEGHTQHYLEIIRDPSLPTLVLSHGSPGSLTAYAAYYTDSMLLSRFNIIAIDRLGFGYSDFGTAIPSLSVQAEALAQVLRLFGGSRKILVGHSMGGPLLARTAMDFPELVDGMVMVAPSVSPEHEPSATWRKAVNIPPLRWLTPPALRVCNQEIIPLKEELEAMLLGWRRLVIPITVVQGTEDQIVPPGNAAFVAQAIADTALVRLTYVEGGDHFILWSEVPLIRQEIIRLLD
jgi:pimeloyl-ACP methyl ester carboxylesterase